MPPEAEPSGRGGNVLVVVMDDVGVDRVAAYGVHPRPARTPRLDGLAEQGVRFTEAYAETVCTPGRVAVLSGRRPVRTAVGTNPNRKLRERGLPRREVLIPEALESAPDSWSTAAVGKWHLAPLGGDPDPLDPNAQGFDHFDGQLGTPRSHVDRDPDPEAGRGYYRWERIVDGQTSISEEYLTTAQADAAIRAMDELPEPWFVYLAFSAIHTPLEVPPTQLFTGPIDTEDPADVGDAMLEALDHELGRVLDAAEDRATVFVTSDNGTSSVIARAPLPAAQAKGTVYAGGTQVPLLVSGPGIAPGVSDSLVHVTDLFSTVLDLAGLAPRADLGLEVDGTSLVPELFDAEPSRRTCAFVEAFAPNGDVPRKFDQAVRDDAYTLVRHESGPDELYRRVPDVPRERVDLLRDGPMSDADREALRGLRRQLRHDP